MKLADSVRQKIESDHNKVMDHVKGIIVQKLVRVSGNNLRIDVIDIVKRSSEISSIPYDKTEVFEDTIKWLINEDFLVEKVSVASMAVQRGDSSGYEISVAW